MQGVFETNHKDYIKDCAIEVSEQPREFSTFSSQKRLNQVKFSDVTIAPFVFPVKVNVRQMLDQVTPSEPLKKQKLFVVSEVTSTQQSPNSSETTATA